MRKNMKTNQNLNYNIVAVDDEIGILDSLSIVLKKAGYNFTGFTNPVEAIEHIKDGHFDLLILDYMMTPLHGDQVVEEIRKFNKDLYILLLTGHRDLVPPIETVKRLDIQGYCEKSDKFDQLLLLIESGIKSIAQVQTIKKINTELTETYNKLERAYLESVETLRLTVEAKDPYTKGHSDRVSKLSILLGNKIDLPKEDLKILSVGSLFHDIGKIGISDNVLLKPTRLSDEEFEEIKKHPSIGVNILNNSTMFKDCLPLIKHHHEKYNGTGYPDGLKGENIPFLARLVAVVDTFDAMSSSRPYRDALSLQIAKSELEKCINTQLDPTLVTEFLDILNNNYEEVLKIYQAY
ncbi:MAG: HD domain-containing protein [Clostridia bacterium]|nr:HD domain-containing protein [Clostridia bacterium]